LNRDYPLSGRLANRRGGRFRLVGAYILQNDLATFPGEAERESFSKSLCASGHDGNPVFQVFRHRSLLRSPVAGRARLLAAYALSGAGMVPPMVYLSDLAARGLGLGVTAGSLVWMVFGAGAVCGTLLGGRAADRLGGARAVRIWLLCQCGALALCLAGVAPALVAAAALGGFSGVGVSAVTLAWARESGGGGGALWAQATAAYAAAQAAAAFALAALFGASGESHAAVFAAGLALSAAALAVARK